jgi:hypothetical protein
VARLRYGTDQMRNSGVMQRLGSSNPNDRRAAGINFADPFVRNRMAGTVMQDFRGIQELDGARIRRKTEFLREAGSGDVRCQTQGEPHHAL